MICLAPRIGWSCLAIMLVLLASPAARSQMTLRQCPFVDRLPDTTTAVCWTDDVGELTRRWQLTELFQLYAADAMRPFWDDAREKRGGLLGYEQLGLTWQDVQSVSTGPAVMGYDLTPKSAGRVLLIDVRGHATAATELLTKIQQRWTDEGLRVQMERKAAGIEVINAAAESDSRFASLQDECLCVTDQRRLLDYFLLPFEARAAASLGVARSQGADVSDGDHMNEGAIGFFIKPWQLVRHLAATPDTQRRIDFFYDHGFDAIKEIVGQITFHENGNEAEFVVDVSAGFPLANAAGLLSFVASADFELPQLMPGEAAGVSCLHWDVAKAFKSYGAIYDSVYAEGYVGAFDDLLNALADDPDGPQIDVRTELIAKLQSRITRCYDYRGPRTDSNPSGRRELWRAKLTDAAGVERAIEQFYEGDPDVTSSQSGGVTVWHAVADGPLLGGDPDNPIGFAFDSLTVFQGHLVLATDRSLLHELVIDTQSSVPVNRQLLLETGDEGEHVVRMWRNLVEVGRNVHAQISENRLQSEGSWEQWLLWHLLSSETPQGRQMQVEGVKLPAFSAIEKSLGQEHTHGSRTKNGWRLQGRLTN